MYKKANVKVSLADHLSPSKPYLSVVLCTVGAPFKGTKSKQKIHEKTLSYHTSIYNVNVHCQVCTNKRSVVTGSPKYRSYNTDRLN